MSTGLESLVDSDGLPLNRTESFYTGTVLPGILCAHQGQGIPKLVELINMRAAAQGLGSPCPEISVEEGAELSSVQMYSEFNFNLAAMGAPDRFPVDDLPDDNTPDFVIFSREPEPTLIAIEAKMFLRTSPDQLRKQLDRQKETLSALAKVPSLNLSPSRIVQAGLIPRSLSANRHYDEASIGYPVILWEDILKGYPQTGGAGYWAGILELALRRWETLVKAPSGQVAGKVIVNDFRAGTCDYQWMGRLGGLNGSLVASDMTNHNWKSQFYAVSADDPGNKNWFPIKDFVQRLMETGQV